MGTAVFWILFWLLIVLLFVSGISRERKRRLRRQEIIKNSFGSSETTIAGTSAFEKSPALFEYIRRSFPDDFYPDDITVNDLGLKDLYSRMNRCLTSCGEDMLYSFFRIVPNDAAKSSKTCEMIERYIKDRNNTIELMYILDSYGKHDDCDEFELLEKLKDARIKSPHIDVILVLLLIFSVLSVAISPLFGTVATLVMLAVCIGTYFSGKAVMDENLKGLAFALRMIACAQKLRENGCPDFDRYEVLFRLQKGARLLPYKDQTTSDPLSIIFDYVRMITHIDLIVYSMKISRIREEIGPLLSVYADIGKVDALIAIASYMIPKKYCRAVITESKKINAKGMYHPLAGDDPVPNDLRASRGIILTGSNASGKSTFLKAVGLNVLFARSLGIAFADEFETAPYTIYTSMALSDNLLGGESYYVVEAKSIRRICDNAKEGNCLCIIDEVLRGTNTIERIAASSVILRSLCRPTVICFAATHDLELAYMLGDYMDCYHFTEVIEGNNVTFPFRLQNGVSDTTNAIRLLAMLGFGESIVSSADELVSRYKTTGKWKD